LVPTQASDGTFVLKKTSDSFMETKTSNSNSTIFSINKVLDSFKKTQNSNTNSATFDIPEVDFDDVGLYQCQYQKSGPSHELNSPLSDLVRLSVTGKKTITSKIIQVQVSGCLTKCSQSPHGHFILSSTVNSASLSFPVAEYEHQGSYSCVYEFSIHTDIQIC
uniref:Immunoglobulin subtype domain-containing protein n=1 Tax=Pundamilia nyererei TaxID=303518 RepID=A0A3B4FZN8_9CICH